MRAIYFAALAFTLSACADDVKADMAKCNLSASTSGAYGTSRDFHVRLCMEAAGYDVLCDWYLSDCYRSRGYLSQAKQIVIDAVKDNEKPRR